MPRKLLEVDKPRGVSSSLAGTRNTGPRTCQVGPSAVINANFPISMIYRASCLQSVGSRSEFSDLRMYLFESSEVGRPMGVLLVV